MTHSKCTIHQFLLNIFSSMANLRCLSNDPAFCGRFQIARAMHMDPICDASNNLYTLCPKKQAIDVKFSQDLTQKKSLKLVNF